MLGNPPWIEYLHEYSLLIELKFSAVTRSCQSIAKVTGDKAVCNKGIGDSGVSKDGFYSLSLFTADKKQHLIR